MKALVYTAPETLSYKDFQDPEPKPDEVLIKIDSVGICGSDMHAFLGHDERRPAPLILGHEAAGVIVGGKRDGERVTVNPLVTSGTSQYSLSGRENLCPDREIISMPPREGAFAQWLSMPETNLVSVPHDVPLEKAALCEPIACGWHAVRLALGASFQGPEDTKALVLGGGAIGVGAALSLQAQGVSDVSVVETNPVRRDYLAKTCSFDVVGLDDLAKLPDFEVVVDGVGFAATRKTASTRVLPGGVIVHIGLGEAEGGLDIRRMTLQEITFIGTYTYTQEDFRQTANAIFDGSLGDLSWIEERPLSDGNQAFEDIRSGRTACPKIILKPW